ncbi:MAG TPA: TRAP transporter substrate-binding protein [Paenirhodobacter sp.]
MKMRMRLALVAALFCAAPICAGVSAETLKFAHFVAAGHTLTQAIVTPLTQAVAPTGLVIETYPAGKLGAGPADQYVRVVQGVADIVWGIPGYTSSQFPLTMLTELPAVQPPGMSGADFLWNGWDAGLLAREFPATVPLALWTAEPAVLIVRGAPVRTPADLAGRKIRVSSAITARVVETLGAIPVQMPAGDVYNALQTGLVDGLITGSSAISDFRFDEVLSHVTVGIPLGNQAFYVVANAKRVGRLPQAEQAALRAAGGRDLSRRAEAAWNARGQAAIAALRGRGPDVVTDLTPEGRAAFDALLLPLTQKMVADLHAQDALITMRGGQ